MKRILFFLICMSLASITQAAMVAFNAEDDSVYYQAGAQWTTVEDEAAMGGAAITATTDMPTLNDENTRFYSFNMPAGTYHLFIRINMDVDNGSSDSCYISNNSLAEDAGMIDFNGVGAADEIDGNPVGGAGNYGWVRARQSYGTAIRTYVQAEDGTAYFKVAPRENGLNVDAFVFVPEADTDTVTGADLEEAVINSGFRRGAATDPVPSGEVPVDSTITTEVSWTAPVDPNIASITGYDVVFGTEPNMPENPVYNVATESLPVTLDFDTTYYWRVDTNLVWDSNDISETGSYNETISSQEWMFTTLPDDITPVVTVNDVLTSMEFLPASLAGTVNDFEEGDIASVTWEVLGTGAVAAAKQMYGGRTGGLLSITADPNLLNDWIGTDTRSTGDPMYLSLKGLPAGTYDWVSYHHDAGTAAGIGTFDVTVNDASGSATTTDITGSDDNVETIEEVTTFATTITSNGTDDVVIVFDTHPYTDQYNEAWFVMNGFELTDGVSADPLYIDFGTVVSGTDANAVDVMDGYEAYAAQHEVSASFTEQSYSAFGTTVSVLPTWAGVEATVTDTTESLLSPTATLSTDWPGSYRVQLTATDNADQSGSDTMVVTVTADACAAAQLSPSWVDFSDYDANEDCLVNLEDFAVIAAGWLDDRNMTAQE